MLDRYHVKLAPVAEDDLDRIFQYISEQLAAPNAANNLMEDMETSIMRLGDFPYSGSPVADDFLSSRGYRKLVVKNYLVFHLIDEANKQVVIMRVLYGAQKYEDLL